jgi:hypothetical protein
MRLSRLWLTSGVEDIVGVPQIETGGQRKHIIMGCISWRHNIHMNGSAMEHSSAPDKGRRGRLGACRSQTHCKARQQIKRQADQLLEGGSMPDQSTESTSPGCMGLCELLHCRVRWCDRQTLPGGPPLC